jgi:hypothetical protein
MGFDHAWKREQRKFLILFIKEKRSTRPIGYQMSVNAVQTLRPINPFGRNGGKINIA